MSQRLVKTIRATQVRSIGTANDAGKLTVAEMARLSDLAARHQPAIQLRQSGLTQQEIRRLEFLRWTLQQTSEERG